ncbi:MAG TPA: DUF1801 domain-containing protein [Candidatus Bathyarchaeia archaeon]|nr:DUF1801 domain-containing protein [Candidatus Bathyarchaeia archaeon]
MSSEVKAPRKKEDHQSASKLTDKNIAEPGSWRGEVLNRIRKLVEETDPEVVEERKWRKPSNPAGVPVWSHDGIICTGETYKNHLRLTFAKGASINDPKGLFNTNLEGNATRAIVIHEGDKIDEVAFKKLVQEAATLNSSVKKKG